MPLTQWAARESREFERIARTPVLLWRSVTTDREFLRKSCRISLSHSLRRKESEKGRGSAWTPFRGSCENTVATFRSTQNPVTRVFKYGCHWQTHPPAD